MYNVSSLFLEDIYKPSRILKCKVLVGNVELTEEQVMDLSITYSLGNEGLPGIGGVVSSTLTLSLIRDGKTPSYYTNQDIKPYIAIKLANNGFYEYIPLGVFKPKPETIEKTDLSIKIECGDLLSWIENYNYDSKLSYPTSATNVLNELKSMFNLPIDTTGLPSATVKVKPSNNPRVVISEIAELFGRNAIINREGILIFPSIKNNNQTLTADNYIDFKLTSDNQNKISKIICEKDEDDLECGDTSGAVLRFENDSITTQSELQTVFNRCYPLNYWAYEMKAQGMPHFEVGDKFTLIDKKNVSRELIILEHTLNYSGGLISEFRANASRAESSTGSTGSNSISSSIQKAQMDVLNVQTILAGNITADNIAANAITADKIASNAITANHLKTNVIEAINANVGTAQIDSALVDTAQIAALAAKDLRIGTAQIVDAAITNAKIGDLEIDTTKIADAAITNAKINDLSADKITAGDISTDRLKANTISAINASLGSATIDSAKIGDIEAEKIKTGDLSADVMKTNSIDAINANIGSATINSAKIGDLSADKIKTGDLSADRIKAGVITAINTSTETALIGSAKIGDIDASKITTGTLRADIIASGSIDADKISTEAFSAISATAGALVANDITAGKIKIGDANIVDGTISGAKISQATITNAQIADATIESAKIKEINASKINAGTLDTSKINICSTSGKLTISDNTITIKDNQETPKTRVQMGLDAQGNYGIYVLNADGVAIFDSDKGVLAPEGLNSDVITTDKIRDEAVSPQKIQINELWANEGFIGNFQATNIDASQIRTGKITGERIDIAGLVSFESLSPEFKKTFSVEGDKTYVNGGMIATNTIKANSIDLLSGITVKGEDGQDTFAIGDDGKVKVNGLLQSSNFEEGKSGYRINTDGTAEFNQAIVRGFVDLSKAGISNDGNSEQSVRIWAGASYEDRNNAPFKVYQNGDVFAANGTFTGVLNGTLGSGDVRINDNKISIVEEGTETEKIIISVGQTTLNGNVAFGSNNVSFLNTDKKLILNSTDFTVNTSKDVFTVNKSGGVSIQGKSGGSHNINSATSGSLVFDSVGNQGTDGDFNFTRKDGAEKCKVNVEGNLSVGDKLSSSTYPLEQRWQTSGTYEGLGFYVI